MKIESSDPRASDRPGYVAPSPRWYCESCVKMNATEIRNLEVVCKECGTPLVQHLTDEIER